MKRYKCMKLKNRFNYNIICLFIKHMGKIRMPPFLKN